MACLCCGAMEEVGALCKSCARDVVPCDGLIPDHVRSTVPPDTDSWVVDGFGCAHPLAPKTTIGRNHEGQLVVLAASVSREHAELRQTDTGWTVRDLGSRNGTYVDGVRCQGRQNLPKRAVLKVGDVAMWFLEEVVEEPAQPATMETNTIGGALVRFTLSHNDVELCVVGGSDVNVGGTLMSRKTGIDKWDTRELPTLEFQLLRMLCARAHDEADSPAAVRGCVPTKQFAKELPFKSKYANEENVRQVVKRLRAVLDEVGSTGALAVVPGRGYYLACPVSVANRA